MIHIHAFVAARRQIVVFIMPFLWYTNFITFAKEAFALKIQESAENYLEAILMIKQEKGQVRSIDVVNELGFSKPSVSVAIWNRMAILNAIPQGIFPSYLPVKKSPKPSMSGITPLSRFSPIWA